MEKRFRKWLILIVLIVLAWVVVASFLADCNWPKTNRSDVVGIYVSNYEQSNYKDSEIYKHDPELQGGIHRLKLKDDGTYEYEFTSFDGKKNFKNSNVWKFEPSYISGRPYIVLSGFGFGSVKIQNQKGQMTSGLPIIRWFGRIRITIRDDYGYYFRKEK